MVTFISKNPEATRSLGEQWGREVQAGWIIGLTGELGAGKTQLVKGLARGLGLKDRIHSPSFTLVNEYRGGRLPLYHLDLYRLETFQEIFNAGLEEYLIEPAGVAVVEWVERWIDPAKGFPTRFRHAQIEISGETERRITYEDFGA